MIKKLTATISGRNISVTCTNEAGIFTQTINNGVKEITRTFNTLEEMITDFNKLVTGLTDKAGDTLVVTEGEVTLTEEKIETILTKLATGENKSSKDLKAAAHDLLEDLKIFDISKPFYIKTVSYLMHCFTLGSNIDAIAKEIEKNKFL